MQSHYWSGSHLDYKNETDVRVKFKQHLDNFNLTQSRHGFHALMLQYLSENNYKPVSLIERDLSEIKYYFHKDILLDGDTELFKKTLFQRSHLDWWMISRMENSREIEKSITPEVPKFQQHRLTKADIGKYQRNGKPLTMIDIEAYNKRFDFYTKFDLKMYNKMHAGEALTFFDKAKLKYRYSKTCTAYYLSKIKKN